MKLNIITFFTVIAALFMGACDNDMEPIDRKTIGPEQQDPELYARYLKALDDYKASEHYAVYARMDNAPAVSTSPKDFMKAMPDSLDYLALRNPLSKFDCEDLPLVKRKGTKVLAWADCSEAATAIASVDVALAQITAHGLDGLVISFTGKIDDTSVTTETAVATKLESLEKILIFEGDPMFVATANRSKYDLFVIDVSETDNVFSLREEVDYATRRLGIPASKIVLATTPESKMADSDLKTQSAPTEVAKCVMVYGPLAGLGVFDIATDYYSPNISYPRVKAAITLLNPCK